MYAINNFFNNTIYYFNIVKLYNKSRDADGINEIPNKLIDVLLYKHYILFKRL